MLTDLNPRLLFGRAEKPEENRGTSRLLRPKTAASAGARRAHRAPHAKDPASAAALNKNTGAKSWCFGRRILAVLCFAITRPSTAATISEEFATDPTQRGWQVFGDASLYHWNATNRNLEVTWDSSHTNSFFYFPLGTVLATNNDFSFAFDLRLSDIRLGNSPGKTNEFEIAVGLLNYRSATNSKAFRGAGVSSAYGVRNLVEFDYFPDAGFGDTFATTMVSSNNAFVYAHNFPLTLTSGDTFRITMSYTASNQLLRTSATRNGAPFAALTDVSPTDNIHFTDFRLDSFAVINYSDAIQTGSPAFYGSVLAHAVVDNVQLTVPSPPLGNLHLRRTNSLWLAEFASATNWIYALEASTNFKSWSDASSPGSGNGGLVRLTDTNPPIGKTFYRIRAERP